MIVHTLIYKFAPSVSEEEQRRFFAGLRELVLSSDLVRAFDVKPHVWLPVDDKSPGMTGTAIAQYAADDLDALRAFSEQPEVHEFIRGRRSEIEYDAAYANHEVLDLTPRVRRHTEHTLTIDAPAEVVWEVLVDVEGYARIFPPTHESRILESSPAHQVVRLVVDVSGQRQSWVSRRDIDAERRVIAYRQLEHAPLIGYMGGEWRALAIDARTTQLVLTHDFQPAEPVDGRVAGRFTYAEAERLLSDAVERNSVDDMAAVRDEAERRAGGAR
ncbi:aromatase/cyclase [Saccharothrix xinjiangensis]|uniref:Aromatase/cyclase n=1 Tax=Saccharothrix xinjiangensis TaxID=204798 RepID=A0ABV9Y928_9PSEU